MRNLFLVTYDVSDAKRLRRVFKVMKDFGEALQYSVFRCELDPSEKTRLVERLHREMNLAADRVMLADLGPALGRAPTRVEWIGRAPQEPDVAEAGAVVV